MSFWLSFSAPGGRAVALAAVVGFGFAEFSALAVAALLCACCCGVGEAMDADCSGFVEHCNSWVLSAQGIAVPPMAVRQTVDTLWIMSNAKKKREAVHLRLSVMTWHPEAHSE